MRFEGDTGPYLLYSYARASSIVRKGSHKKVSIESVSSQEAALVKVLSEFPAKVAKAAINYDPSAIAHYSFTLAQTFNEFYVSCKVIGSPAEGYRLQLVEAFRIVLKNSLQNIVKLIYQIL